MPEITIKRFEMDKIKNIDKKKIYLFLWLFSFVLVLIGIGLLVAGVVHSAGFVIVPILLEILFMNLFKKQATER